MEASGGVGRRLEQLRSLAKDALENDMATTAAWYADKLVTLSRGQAEDVLLLARAYYGGGEYGRAARLLSSRKTFGSPRQPAAQFARGDTAETAGVELRARLLAARCWAQCGKPAEAAATLEPALAEAAVAYLTEDEDDDLLGPVQHYTPAAGQENAPPPVLDESNVSTERGSQQFASTTRGASAGRVRGRLEDPLFPSSATRNLFGRPSVGESSAVAGGGLEEEDDDDEDDLLDDDDDDEDDLLETAEPPLAKRAERVDLAAAACCVVGRAYEALENRDRAVDWLERAVRIDPRCAEAVTFLVERRLLSAAEERRLRDDAATALSGCDDEQWRVDLYAAVLGVHDPMDGGCVSTNTETDAMRDENDYDDENAGFPTERRDDVENDPARRRGGGVPRFFSSERRSSSAAAAVEGGDDEDAGEDAVARQALAALDRTHGLGENGDVARARAERAYRRHDARAAYRLSKRAYAADPYDLAAVPTYVASMVELGESHELFSVAHALVKAYPKDARSWFAVGCYYLLVGKFDAAQRYFHKSAKLNPRFAPAWIGFGNAFAMQDESEQAMAAYRSASRLFQGSHLPLLFIGMEYLRTNNLPLAKHFLLGARRLCPSDPTVANELGVVALRQGAYADAARDFSAVLDRYRSLPDKAPLKLACEASVFNLAQAHSKLGDFNKAAHYFQLALALNPNIPSTRVALAAVYHILGGALLHKAVEQYHIALALRPQDGFAVEMLNRALRDVLDVDDPNPLFSFQVSGPGDDDDDDPMRDSSPLRRRFKAWGSAATPGLLGGPTADLVHSACDIDQP